MLEVIVAAVALSALIWLLKTITAFAARQLLEGRSRKIDVRGKEGKEFTLVFDAKLSNPAVTRILEEELAARTQREDRKQDEAADEEIRAPAKVRPRARWRKGQPGRNVLVIPGMFGSKLELDGSPIWDDLSTIRSTLLNPAVLLDDRVTCSGVIEEMNRHPLKIAPLGLSITLGAPSLLVYGPLLRNLVRTGASVHAFPYNWTRGIREVSDHLEQWFISNRSTERWVLIGHGFGGLVVSRFLSSPIAREIQLDHIILVGAPLLGTARAVGLLLGLADEFPRLAVFGRALRMDDRARVGLQNLFLRMPSLYDLLPPDSDRIVYDSEGLPRPLSELPEIVSASQGLLLRDGFDAAIAASGRTIRESHDPSLAVKQLPSCPRLSAIISTRFSTPASVAVDSRGEFRYVTFEPGDDVVTATSATAAIPRGALVSVDSSHAGLPTSHEVISHACHVVSQDAARSPDEGVEP